MQNKDNIILITGAAGFIGAELSKRFLRTGFKVIGIDNINNYYDINLKKDRIKEIELIAKRNSSSWKFYKDSIEDVEKLNEIFESENPSIIVNLAAQAGVRYSLINPYSFIQNNITGFGNILEISRKFNIKHLVYASSSSVYGGNKSLPYKETQSVNHPVSIYAATKISNELMAHTYSHLYKIPTTGLRFFTVYGPWGRPDMAPMIFAKAILKGEEIKVNNYGKMSRDFTYIDDIVEGIYKCCLKPATPNNDFDYHNPDPASSIAPYRIFNIGNDESVDLMDFIQIIEKILGKKAKLSFRELPKGDVVSTNADTNNLKKWINFKPNTTIENGMESFLKWYVSYYK